MEEAQQRAHAAEKSRVEMVVALTRKNTLVNQLRVSVTELTLRAGATEQQLKAAQQLVKKAEKRRDDMSVSLQRKNESNAKLRDRKSEWTRMQKDYSKVEKQRNKAERHAAELTKSVETVTNQLKAAQQSVNNAHQRVNKAEKRSCEMSVALQRTKDMNTELRGCKSEYSRMQKEYPKVKNQRDNAERQVAELTKRVETAENQLKALHKHVQVEPTTSLSFATRIWPKVAKVMGLDEADVTSITRAARSMHDTKSEDWEHSMRNRTQLTKRLPAAVRLLLSNLFRCVRVHTTTIPVEDILDYVYRRKLDDTKLLGDIRQAVRAAIKERRLTDAKVLLTLSVSSFGERRQIQRMKRFFSYSEPIFVGSTVMFMKQMATTPVGKAHHVTTSPCHHHVTM